MKSSREANPFLFIFKSHEHIYRLSYFKIQNFVLLDQDIKLFLHELNHFLVKFKDTSAFKNLSFVIHIFYFTKTILLVTNLDVLEFTVIVKKLKTDYK